MQRRAATLVFVLGACAACTSPAREPQAAPARETGAASPGTATPGTAAPSAAAPSAPTEHAAPPAQALLRELCATTRLAGTHASLDGARAVARHLADAGFAVEIVPRVVLLAYPRRSEFAVFEPGATAPLVARTDSFDPDRVPTPDVPLYNAWSGSGTVRAPVVDAGRGTRADFERLKAAGVDLRGTIALCRYGSGYRGIKVDLAAQHGCAGVLLWSDPEQDGAARGPVWPDGPWKPAHEAQRGSISPIGRTPGDPSTPGWPSPRPGADGRRLAGAELAAALPAIPCLPIGADDARAILAGLAPRAFVGADGAVAERPVGPGPREARISVDSPRELRTTHDVIATLPGASDEFVLGGAHRDAWVRGAVDNGTGCVVLLRAAQILGQRARAGWRPPRTLKLAFWDAEEFGLIGSTEWAEEHAELLRARCTAYVNSDVAVTGTRFGGASGTPGMLGALEPVLRRVAGTAQTSLWDEWIAKTPAPRLGLPGSGSDFAVFVHHLNVPYVEVGLSGAGGGGFYHTAFDGVELLERFVDPGYVGHELAARLHAELFLELLERGRDAFDGAEAARRLADEAAKLGESVPALADVATELAVAFRATAAALEREPRAGRDLLRELEVAAGLPGRPWHRNALWSPGLEDGYGSETFPALRAAAQDHQAARAAAAPILAGLARLRARAGDP